MRSRLGGGDKKMVEIITKEPKQPLEYKGKVQPKPGEKQNGHLLYPYSNFSNRNNSFVSKFLDEK